MITWHTYTDEKTYNDTRYLLLYRVEETGKPQRTPYLDTIQTPPIPTMGIGFNLLVPENLNTILTEMGFNVSATGKEGRYIKDIVAAVKARDIPELNSIMYNWKKDAAVSTHNGKDKRSNFSLSNDEIENIFNAIAPRYEAKIDAWIAQYGLTIEQYSRERAVLFSLAYNSLDKNHDGIPDLLGDKLGEAMRAGNRAEAWFEIRYGSNGNGAPGIAKRRYYEADLFGLYNDSDNPTLTEAKSIYSMLQKHRPEIITYEQTYGNPFDGSAPTEGNQVTAANNDYSVTWVKSLEGDLNSAMLKIIEWLNTAYPSAIQNYGSLDFVKSYNILLDPLPDTNNNATLNARYMKNGTEIGAENIIIGEGGNDVLEGGKGNDLLIGGDGNDTYIIKYGDGYDTIYDTQGTNTIKYTTQDGKEYSISNFYSSKNSSDVWISADNKLQITHHSPWQIIFEDGSTITLTDGSDPEDFGINLIDTPTDPTITNTIVGTSEGDHLYDTGASDKISGYQGNDTITSNSGGNDWLQGGDGRDAVSSYAENSDDLIEGGLGGDLLFGGPGDDRVFGENEGEMEDLIAAGETASSFNEQGDFISGGSGNDFIYGVNGKDLLLGGEGLDLLVGGGGDDVILGDAEFTTVFDDWSVTVNEGGTLSFVNVGVVENNTTGDDVIYAGTGNDVVWGEGGDDEIYGGEGNDTLNGDAPVTLDIPASAHGDDYIDGGAGNDVIWGFGANDMIYGGEGDDVLSGDAQIADLAGDFHGDDYIDGGAGNDTIYGSGGSDTIYGGEDNDVLFGDASDVAASFYGDDYLDGGTGADTLVGGAGDDLLFGGDGDDELQGDASDVASADQGNDYLDGESGDDVLYGFGGSDTLYGGDGNDWLQGEEGDDYLDGQAGDNTLLGGTGDDTLYGGDGNNWLQGDDGDDYIEGGTGVETILGGTGNDYIQAGSGTSTISGGADNDTIYGGGGSGQLQGDDGDDYIEGRTGVETILGGTGNDTLIGGLGNDIFMGGTGNDSLAGGDGSDTYYYNIGDGIDVIDDLSTESEIDTIVFGEGIAVDDLTLTFGTDRLIINVGSGGTDRLELLNFDPNDWLGPRAIGSFVFSDSTSITYEELIATKQKISGTNAAETINADDQPNNIVAYDGNDTLYGLGSGDILDGGTGADSMIGGTGNDKYIVDNSGDTVVELADEGNDTVESSISYTLGDNVENLALAGSDPINGTGNALDNALTGNSGANVLTGGAGYDTLNGGSGADTMLGGTDDDLYIVDNAGDVVTELTDEGYDEVQSSVSYTLTDNVESLTLTGNNAVNGTGNTLDNYIIGNSASNILTGLEGNDYLDGASGSDTLSGGSGDDTYYWEEGYGNDTVVETGGSDTLSSWSLYSTDLEFGLSQDNNYNDIIITNTYTDETLTLKDWFASDDNKVEAFQFADADLTAAEVQEMVLASGAVGTDGDDYIHGPTNFGAAISGFAGNDTLYGGSLNDTLDGGTGNDSLLGGTGDDTYIWGSGVGNDIINDESGVDAIVLSGLNSGDVEFSISGCQGDDGIIVKVLSTGETLRLQNWFADDNYKIDSFQFDDLTLTAAQVESVAIARGIVSTEGDDIIYTPKSTGVTVHGLGGNDYINAGDSLENNVLYGDEGNDQLYGGSGNDLMEGGSGDDGVYGGDGDDTIIGGLGDDTIAGGGGDNLLIWGTGMGNDGWGVIETETGTNTIQFAGLNAADVEFEWTTIYFPWTGMVFTIKSTGETMTIPAEWVVQYFQFEDVRIEYDSTYQLMTAVGTENNDTITMPDWDGAVYTLLYGKAGNDYLYGQDSDDEIYGGDGNDVIAGGAGNDIIDGDEDTFYPYGVISHDGGVNADTMLGGTGDDWYEVNDVSDVVVEYADEGYDMVESSVSYTLPDNVEDLYLAGTDSINGTGNDLDNWIEGNNADNILSGGAGSDTYGIFRTAGGLGHDTINESGPSTDTDTVYFYDVASPDDLDVTRSGDDLIIAIKNSQDSITITDWFVDAGTNNHKIEQFVFSDETIVTGSDIEALALPTIEGTDGNDTLYGTTSAEIISGGLGNDYLDGDEGNDIIYGGDGDDYLDGNIGSDTMYGGSGDDIYVFSLNDGNDTLVDSGADATTSDQVLFGSDVLQSTVALFQSGQDLVIGYGSTDTITITDQFSADYGVENVQLDNGLYLTNADINTVIQQITAFAANNGITLTNIDSVRANQDLMNIIVNAWHV